MNKCLCGSKQENHSCLSIISSEKEAATAEDLMRSRYVAFCLSNVDYILYSYSKDTCPKDDKKDILEWSESVKFINLEIINVKQGSLSDNKGVVEFKASFIDSGKTYVMHEVSRFQRENNIWKYIDGYCPD